MATGDTRQSFTTVWVYLPENYIKSTTSACVLGFVAHTPFCVFQILPLCIRPRISASSAHQSQYHNPTMPSYSADQKRAIAEVVEVTGLTDAQAARVSACSSPYAAIYLPECIINVANVESLN